MNITDQPEEYRFDFGPREVTGSFTTFFDADKWTKLLQSATSGTTLNIKTVYRAGWRKRLPALAMYLLFGSHKWRLWNRHYPHPDVPLGMNLPNMYITRVERDSSGHMSVDFSSKPLTEEV